MAERALTFGLGLVKRHDNCSSSSDGRAQLCLAVHPHDTAPRLRDNWSQRSLSKCSLPSTIVIRRLAFYFCCLPDSWSPVVGRDSSDSVRIRTRGANSWRTYRDYCL